MDSNKKNNYLLVMPRLTQNSGDGYSFPLGITYISASMKSAGYNVFTINLNSHLGNVSDILKTQIRKNKISVVATGGLSFQYNTVRNVLEIVKKINDEIITIVGGGIITGDPLPAMQALELADFGVIGEGEVTINALCHALETHEDVFRVGGIIYKKKLEYIITEPRQEIEDISTIPWPDYAGFDIDHYLDLSPPGISGLNNANTLFMLASRSCPYNCTFCFHTVGKKYRQRSLDDFFAELDSIVDKHNVKFICLADELFARDIERVKEFCARIKKYAIQWWAQFRVDDVTPELIEILKDGGCHVMSFGLESADNRILKSMRKHTTVEQIEYALSLVYREGIPFTGAFIFGDIEETAETAANTLKWWEDHAEYNITLNLITVYPGSFLYKFAIERGIITDRVRFLKDGCPQINVSKLNDDEMSVLIRKIVDAPMLLTRNLDSVKLVAADYRHGRICIDGECSICGAKNYWENVKLFTMNFIECKKCKQKYNVPLPNELRNNISTNLTKLLEKYKKIAVWGINFHSADLFEKLAVMQNENIFPVDISETKRKMNLHGRKISSPDIVDRNNIKVVVVAIPVYVSQIASQVANNHSQVEQLIDICLLTDPEYDIQNPCGEIIL